MKEITNPKLLWLKASLFVVIGMASAFLLLLDMPRLRDGVFFALSVWAFCRAYYFAFYVIEHYIDERFKFAGLISVIQHIIRKSEHSKQRPNVK